MKLFYDANVSVNNTVPIKIQVELGSSASNASVLLVCDSNIVEERNKSPGHYILDEK